MEICYTCGNGENEDYKDVECPDCGHKWNNPIEFASEEKLNNIVHIAGAVKIPQEYIGIDWDREYLISTKRDLMGDETFIKFCDSLERFKSVFGKGMIPSKSLFLYAPPTFSKVTLAYNCMQLAIANNFRVAPLLDTVEVKRLLTKGSEDPDYKMYGYLDLEDYITTDIVFITVTKSSYRYSAPSTIVDLIDKRSRKGLPTFILSRYSIHELSSQDEFNELKYLMDNSRISNDLKYPAFVQYELC